MPEQIKPKQQERRLDIRLTCQTPIGFKICKEETISKMLEGYAINISNGGLRCTIAEDVPLNCTLWLKLDPDALALCEEMDKKVVIVQHGVLGKVIWVDKLENGQCDVGVQFITREEKKNINFIENL